MQQKKILGSVLVALLVCSAAIKAEVNLPANNQVNTTYDETKLNVVVSSKQPEFTINLKSNPTTGYSWFLREYDANLLTPLKHEFNKGDTKLIGAPGSETWTFRVKNTAFNIPQQTTLRFVYARPWQGADGSSQLVFRITIVGK